MPYKHDHRLIWWKKCLGWDFLSRMLNWPPRLDITREEWEGKEERLSLPRQNPPPSPSGTEGSAPSIRPLSCWIRWLSSSRHERDHPWSWSFPKKAHLKVIFQPAPAIQPVLRWNNKKRSFRKKDFLDWPRGCLDFCNIFDQWVERATHSIISLFGRWSVCVCVGVCVLCVYV